MGFRKPALTDEFKVYSLSDPCIETSDENKYLQTLDKFYLIFKGDDASVFTLAPPSTSHRAKTLAISGSGKPTIGDAYEACEYLVRACWRDVSNFMIGDEQLKLEFENGLVKKEIIDKIQDTNLIFELAAYARQIGHLPFFRQKIG